VADRRLALLFTDIEGSTALARRLGARWPAVRTLHHAAVGDAIARHGGQVDGTAGDSFFALFETTEAAARAAVEAQQALHARSWPEDVGELRVRMGVHAGTVSPDEHGWTGIDIHLAARVQAAAHGGQVLVSRTVREELGEHFVFEDAGLHRLNGFPAPEQLFLLRHDDRGLDAFPPLRTEPVRPTNLPARQRRLVGREHDLQHLVAAFTERDERLLTLAGPGGTGKTSLATAAGEALLSAHVGGVWLVPLAEEQDPDAVLPAIAATIGVAADPAALQARLYDRPTLLILDNLEQLLDAGPALGDLVDQAPALRILATSRLPLRVAGEHVVRLAPLAPEAAVEMFLDRARAVAPDLASDGVPELCRWLDGMPLAIELAAARAGVLSPAAILERLHSSLTVLSRSARDREPPARQRSLVATLEWTHDLLLPEERILLRRMATFAGPVPLEAVEALAAVPPAVDAVEALDGLLEASFARRNEHPELGLRFDLPQAARTFALGKLAEAGEEDAVRRAHAAHVAAVAEPNRWFTAGVTPATRRRLLAVDAETRPALAWAREHEPALHAVLAGRLTRYLSRSGRSAEVVAELERAHAQADAVEPAEGGWIAVAHAWGRQQHGDTEGLVPLVEDGVARLREAGDRELLGYGLRAASVVTALSGTPERAVQLQTEALAISRALGNLDRLSTDLGFASQALVQARRLDEAEAALEELLALDREETGYFEATLRADIAAARDDHAEAARWYARFAAYMLERDDVGQALFNTGFLHASLGRLGRWPELLEVRGLSERISEESAQPGLILDPAGHAALLAQAREQVPDADALIARGRATPRTRWAERILALSDATG
jgi:predicted ATPase/class 3 adenylate cyclase